MKKKHPKLPQWIKGAGLSIVVLPILAFSWSNIQAIWASPSEVKSVREKVEKQETVQEQLSRLVVEQQSRIERNEAIYQANLESTKEQLQLIAELKKKR